MRRPLCGLARKSGNQCPSVFIHPNRSLRHHRRPAGGARASRRASPRSTGRSRHGVEVAEAARLRRPRLPGRRRLHGPGQLGHRSRRRLAVRLHAAQRHPALEPDGGPAAGARARSSASSPAATSRRPAAITTRRPVSFVLWVLCEIAIAACDLAEVIGSAIALNLLFDIPLAVGVVLTALDVLLVLLPAEQGLPRARGARHHAHRDRSASASLFEIILARPDIGGVLARVHPDAREIVTQPRRCSTSPSASSARR